MNNVVHAFSSPRFDLPGVLRWPMILGLVLALTPVWAPSVSAQTDRMGQATINITSLADDGVTPLPFARFQIIASNGELITTRESTPPSGTVNYTIDFTDPDLTYTVTMETPPACAIRPDDQEVGPFEDGDSVDLIFETSFENGCELGAISVYAYNCPNGLDLTVDDYAQYRDNCVEAENGKTFTLEAANEGQSFSLTTGAYGIDGRAPIVGLLPGDYAVSEDGGDPNRTLVYCLTYDGTPIEAPAPSETTHESFNGNDQIDLSLGDRSRIACDFFTVTEALPGTGDDEAPDEGNGDEVSPAADDASIEFHVATCPAGYSGGDYFNDCADNGTDDVEFTVEGQSTGHTDSAVSNVPSSPGFGIAVVNNLPADTYTMSENVPGDLASVWVYCANSPGGGDRIPTPENGSQEFDIELNEGQAVICDWFITPDQQFEFAVLRLTKFTCEAGYGGTTFADFTGDCTDPTENVAFNLSNGSGLSVDDSTNSDGKIRYTELPPSNDYVLDEDLPGDALDYRTAFCATDGADYIEYGVESDGSIDLDPINEGQEIQCLWYNIPTDQSVGDGSLRIHKSECPAGTTSNYFATCYDDVVGGIGFEVDGPGSYSESGTTGDNGLLTFENLPSGSFTASEIAPADYSVAIYVVVCTRDGNSFPTTYDDSTGLRIKFNLPAGANIVCDWYNVPKGEATSTPSPDGGSITVIKRLCLDDLEDIKSFESECAPYGAGVEFALTSRSTGASQNAKTNANSRIVFDGLENGTYSLDEVAGDWCKAQADYVDASGNVLVQNGGNTNVYIYNCGTRDISTLPSTGTGESHSTLPFSFWAAVLIAVMTAGGGIAVKPAMSRIRRY